MSLPPAKKSIDINPSKMGVTEPTNVALVEKDVDHKMKFYGVIQAFRRGRMPDNAQLDATLRYLNTHSPVDLEKLSPDGRRLINDIRELLEITRLQLNEKNSDEVLQRFIWDTSNEQFRERAKQKGQSAIGDTNALPEKDEARRDGRLAVEHLRTLAQLLVTNSEARKLISDFTLIGRDIFAQSASRVAERARPDPERMARVDDPAPSSAWGGDHAQGATGGLPEVAPGVDFQKDGFRGALKKGFQQAKDKADSKADERAAKSDRKAEDHAAKADVPAHAEGTPPVASAASPVSDQATPEDSPAVAEGKQESKKWKARIPDKHKDRARAEADRVKTFFDEEFPKERRDQFIWRLKKVVTECQSQHGYQDAITWFLDTAENYFRTAKAASKDQGRSAQGIFGNDPTVQQAWNELRVLLERFAGGRSLDPIFDAIHKLVEDARADAELRDWWRRVDGLVRKTLLEPGFILSPQFNSKWDEVLKDDTHSLFDERYRSHRELVINESRHWTEGWAADPLNKRWGHQWGVILKDLLMNSEGKMVWKGDLWRDVRNVILPEVIQQVGYIPIPRVEYTDNQLDMVIENLTLQGKNLFPNLIDFTGQTHVRISPYKTIKDEMHTSMTLTLSQIQADMRDVAFYFNKKSGLPRFKDSGIADVFLGGKGITIKLKITVVSDSKSKESGKTMFKLESVNAKVDTLKFSIRDSRHDLLYKTVRPLATALIKRQIAKGLEDGIRSAFEFADAQIVQVRQRVSEAQTSDMSSIEKVKSVVSAATASTGPEGQPTVVGKAVSAKEKAEKRNSRFKVVAARESSILPGVGSPHGWVQKAPTSAEDEAVDAPWKSHAFDIVPGTQSNTSTNAHQQQASNLVQ